MDMVENAAVSEVALLSRAPAAEVGDVGHADLREAVSETGGHCRIARAVEVLGGQNLSWFVIELREVGLGAVARALAVHDAIDHGHRRLGQDGDGRGDDVDLVRSQFTGSEECLVLPRQQDVADAALDEGGGRPPRAGVQHRHTLEQFGDEGLRGLVPGRK